MSFGDLAMDSSSIRASAAYPPDSYFHDRYTPSASPFHRSDFYSTPRSSLSDASPSSYRPPRGPSSFPAVPYSRFSPHERSFEADPSPSPMLRKGLRPASERSERSERSEISDKPDKPEGPDMQERSERSERVLRLGRSGRSDRPERSLRPGRPDRPERLDRPEKSEKPDKPDRPERSERSERSERAERPKRADPATRPLRSDRPDRPGSERPHSRKHRRASKEDGAAEREAEPPSLASLRREIEANRGELLAMALQQNGCR